VSFFELLPSLEEGADPFPCRKLFVHALSPMGLLPSLGEFLPLLNFSQMLHAHQEIMPNIAALVKQQFNFP
jgi:hypothetical protein